MKTCSSFPIWCSIWYYMSLVLPNSYVLKWLGGAVLIYAYDDRAATFFSHVTRSYALCLVSVIEVLV